MHRSYTRQSGLGCSSVKSSDVTAIYCYDVVAASPSATTKSRANWKAAMRELSCSFSLVPDAKRYLQAIIAVNTDRFLR